MGKLPFMISSHFLPECWLYPTFCLHEPDLVLSDVNKTCVRAVVAVTCLNRVFAAAFYLRILAAYSGLASLGLVASPSHSPCAWWTVVEWATGFILAYYNPGDSILL